MFKSCLHQFTSIYTSCCIICTLVSSAPNSCAISVEHRCMKAVQNNDKKIMSKYNSI